MVLLKYSQTWQDGQVWNFTIEELDASNVGLLSLHVPAASLKDPAEYLKYRPDWAVVFREGSPREVLYVNAIEAVVRHWRCRRNRRLLTSWEPMDPRFIGLENRPLD